MITLANALIASLAYLQCQKAGHTMSLPLDAAKGYDLADWCKKNNLAYWIDGKTLTLQIMADGNDFTPPDSTIPVLGTPISKLHPGNRFRVMFGQPLLPQSSSTDGD